MHAKWTPSEDRLVTQRMREAIEQGKALQDVARDLAAQIPHTESAILRRWYTVLRKGESARCKRPGRVPFNTNIASETVEWIRRLADEQGCSQGDVIDMAIRRMVEDEQRDYDLHRS
jgi:hypothetical protein